MKPNYFDADARRKTVSLTINSDLLAKAREEGINVSRTAEAALAAALAERRRARLRTEIEQDLRALEAYVEEYNSPEPNLKDMLRDLDRI